jgi:flagellar M-ring protein FliF
MPEKTLLASEQAPATASVTIMEKPGSTIDAAQVRAITHLVASSVEGLRPENVVVVDVSGNMLASGESTSDSSAIAQVDTRRAAELQTAHELQQKVQNILDRALGPNKSVVQASVSMNWTEKETTTQAYDPATSAIRSSQQVMETYTTTQGTLEGIPGATSNLPTGSSSTSSNGQGVSYTRTDSTVNYEVTQIQTHQVDTPGQINKLSLSVLVDVITDTNQLASLRNVIGAAAGIDEARGDVLVVESLAFDRSYYTTQAADIKTSQNRDLYTNIAEIAVGVIATAAILWYVMRLLKNLRLSSSEAWTPVLKPVSEMALPSPGSRPQFGAGFDKGAEKYGRLAEGNARSQSPAHEKRMPKIELPTISPEFDQLQKAVTDLVESDPSSIAEAIQLWLTEDDHHNG